MNQATVAVCDVYLRSLGVGLDDSALVQTTSVGGPDRCASWPLPDSHPGRSSGRIRRLQCGTTSRLSSPFPIFWCALLWGTSLPGGVAQ